MLLKQKASIQKKLRIVLLLLLLLLSLNQVKAEFKLNRIFPERPHGFFEINLYQDTREQQVITEKHFIKFNDYLSYFSFIDFYTVFGGDFLEFDSYFTEHNIMLKLFDSPFDYKTQWQSSTGDNNEVVRFGLQTRMHDLPWIKKLFKFLNLKYNFTCFPAEVSSSDQYVFQLQHVYQMKVLPKLFKNRLYIAGFHDDNFFTEGLPDGRKHVAVSELQLGYRLIKGLHAVIEGRHNGFWAEGQRWGLGMGLEYKLSF